MVMTNKDIADLNKQLDEMKENKGPNDLERRIEELQAINSSHKKLNGNLRSDLMFYKKKAEHFELMTKQLKKENQEFRKKTSDMIDEFRNKGDM
tara:strand:- start:370 stop:651 length:282 start_codon:yes stop_codon:yes gene_type:complete